MMKFRSDVAGGEGRDRSSFSDLAKQFVAVQYPQTVWQGNTHTAPQASAPSLEWGPVATGTYKALCGVVHVAQLEALLVLKGLCQGDAQFIRRQGALPTALELEENSLERRQRETWSV